MFLALKQGEKDIDDRSTTETLSVRLGLLLALPQIDQRQPATTAVHTPAFQRVLVQIERDEKMTVSRN